MNKKIALVVGCGRQENTGEAIVKKLKKEGYYVIGADISVRGKIVDYFEKVDITKENEVDKLMKDIKFHKNKLNLVVNSAGVNLLGQIQNYDEEKWDRTIDVNLKGNFLLLQKYVQYFDETKYKKKFISITSDTGMIAKSATFAYGASKAGANHFIKCAARELNKYHNNWIVTALAPGMIEGTPMDNKTIKDLQEQRNISKKEARELLLNNIPLDRGLKTSEVADWIYFLATKGEYASGNIIRVDSGQQQG